MNKFRFLFSLLALTVGVGIIGISFSTASSGEAYSGNQTASTKQFYLDEEILPDHLLYPVLAATDRARLELATPTDRIYLQVEYGHRRLMYAEELLNKKHNGLALTTLTKSQKYMILASQEYLDQELSPNIGRFLLRSLSYHFNKVEKLKPDFTPQEVDIIEKLCGETRALQDRIKEKII